MKRSIARVFSFFCLVLAVAIPAATAQSVPKRIAMSNGLVFPYTNVSSTSYVRHYQKLRIVPSSEGVTYSNIELTYVNFAAINGGESVSFQPVKIQAEIFYNGTYYPVTFNGQTTATILGGDHVTGSVAGLTLPAGAQFYERVRLVGMFTDQEKYLTSHGARRILLEGTLAGADPNVNLLGGKEGHGATCTFVIQSGKIVSGAIGAQGSNYATGGQVLAYDPTTRTEAAVGYSNRSGDKMTSIVITAGGSNYSESTKCVIAGGGGFGQNAAAYAASMITGVPNVAGLQSILIVGDSIARGYGSTDSMGDDEGNYGIFERAISNRHATASTALAGNTAIGYRSLAAHTRMYEIVLPYVTHAMINLGTNDISVGYAAASVANANILSASELRNAGIKVSFVTLIPRVSGTYSTLAGQTPISGFAPGEAADTYNRWVRDGTNGMTSDWGVIDARAVYQDGSDQNKWRVDSVMTNDGIHPNLGAGIPFGADRLANSFSLTTVSATSSAGSTGSQTPTASPAEIVSYSNNTTINTVSTTTSITVYGTGNTINGDWASYTLSAMAGGNTINAGSAQATLNIGGSGNVINIGRANTWINDGGEGNVIRLSAAAGGVAVISGNIFDKGTKLDLSTLLASTSWDGNMSTIDRHLEIWLGSTVPLLLVNPTGSSAGTKYVAAKLTSYEALTLSTVLAHSTF